MRQFGAIQRIDMAPMEAGFQRVDGRGKADVDWVDYHHSHIQLWENRHASVVQGDEHQSGDEQWLVRYLCWYRSWANLYLLQASKEAPVTYYPRAPAERVLRHSFLNSEEIFQPYFGGSDNTPVQHSINHFEELCSEVRRGLHIWDDRFTQEAESEQAEHIAPIYTPGGYTTTYTDPGAFAVHGPGRYYTYPTPTPPLPQSVPGPSTYADAGPSTYADAGPSTYYTPHSDRGVHIEEVDADRDLRGRPVRPPVHYTPGTDALPRRRRRK